MFYNKLFRTLTVYHRTNEVGGQQVGRKLDTIVFGIDQLSQCFNCQCLRQTRHSFQQNMPIGQQPYQKRFHEMFLSDNHFVHSRHNRVNKSTFPLDLFIQFFYINCLAHIMGLLNNRSFL